MNPKIVLVEDEEILRENLKEILEINNFEVSDFSNGNQVLEYLKSNKTSLIISDLMMPEMDGHRLLQQIRSNEWTKDIPFILLSAKIEQDDRDKSFALGADQYLIKPIKTVDLIKSIKSILKD
ncbi:response regulator [Mongoliibacter ruber]|uniref:Twitching motility two-component system response regulator PilH n=1 Tax=Mongoliibacter ruber TaxID=1750599 RepID=A0A2T0WPD4_9BACT|nr:response regulator [Mongoliibacter ruber]PRY88568.1 twitching motility two-component system response regulator PilH [Mongoliibacter ruber]